MYVARDKDGSIFVYDKRPKKNEKMWCGAEWLLIKDCTLPKSINPKWTDPEPIEVKLVRKNK